MDGMMLHDDIRDRACVWILVQSDTRYIQSQPQHLKHKSFISGYRT